MTSQREERAVREIECEDDAGKRFTVIEHKIFVVSISLSGQRRETAISNVFRLKSGAQVNWLDEERFVIGELDKIIRKVR